VRVQVRRMYAPHRRAWTPRIWPVALAAGVVDAAAIVTLHAGVLLAIAIGAGTGLGFPHVRWTVWRHRHPIITPAQYITDLRRQAPWN
jgi:hypothetical protein